MRKTITSMKQWFACLGLFAGFSASAQVASYTFSQAAGTYTAITGTTIASGAMDNMDDNVFGPIAMPAFAYDGTIYTSIYISTNGYITFGLAPDPAEYLALSGTMGYAGAVAAFSEDLEMAATGTKNIRYQQVGNEFVVQWQNVRRYLVDAERISFQIRLNSVTNQIKIVYGGTIAPGDGTDYPEVGLRGPDNTFGTNINNRRVNAATGSWINSIAGTNNASTCYFNSATAGTVPAAGATFTWTPPALNPGAEKLALPSLNGCYGKAETVSATIRNVGGAAINFATTPVTINATASGTNPATFAPVTVNTGTLAVNAALTVQIAAAYDMSVHGAYAFDYTLTATGDAQVSNNHAVDVRNSHTPAVAYSDLSGCSGQNTVLAGTATAYPYTLSLSNITSVAIPDDNTTGINSTMVVSGAGTLPASAVVATINSLTHTFDGDLILTLMAPDGSSVTLSNGNGGDADFINTQFSDAATMPISAGDSPFTGSFNPETPFSGLTGLANGTWTLHIVDNAAADVGSLNSWSLTFNVANSISTYSWTPSADLSSVTAANPSAAPALSTLYLVTATDQSGCANTDSVQLTINAIPAVTASSTAAVLCAGSTVILTGGGAATYTWTGSVTNGVAFAPSATDTYTVTGTDANGCTNTATTTITVNTLPGVTANSSSATACAGDGVIFTGSGASSYTWTGGVVDNVVFTPATTDTYTVTGTDINGCTNTATTTVTVNALPTVTATSNATGDAVCSGGSVILTGGGATSYTWSGTVNDGVAFTPSVTDTYTVTGTDGNGCEGTGIITVTVNALPTVDATVDMTTVCSGNTVLFSGNGATSYTWTTGVTDGVAYTPASTQTYTVTGTDANGCEATDTVSVVVNALPAVNITSTAPSIMCVYNAAIMLDGESPAGGTWSGTGVTGTTFDPAAAGAGTAVITYSYTDANGCSNSDTMSIAVDVCTGIAAVETNEIGLTAYPNPANGVVNVNISNAGTEEVQLQMVNIMGEEVYNQQVYASGADFTTQIDISSFAKGTYLLKVNTGSLVKVMKIVKQ